MLATLLPGSCACGRHVTAAHHNLTCLVRQGGSLLSICYQSVALGGHIKRCAGIAALSLFGIEGHAGQAAKLWRGWLPCVSCLYVRARTPTHIALCFEASWPTKLRARTRSVHLRTHSHDPRSMLAGSDDGRPARARRRGLQPAEPCLEPLGADLAQYLRSRGIDEATQARNSIMQEVGTSALLHCMLLVPDPACGQQLLGLPIPALTQDSAARTAGIRTAVQGLSPRPLALSPPMQPWEACLVLLYPGSRLLGSASRLSSCGQSGNAALHVAAQSYCGCPSLGCRHEPIDDWPYCWVKHSICRLAGML